MDLFIDQYFTCVLVVRCATQLQLKRWAVRARPWGKNTSAHASPDFQWTAPAKYYIIDVVDWSCWFHPCNHLLQFFASQKMNGNAYLYVNVCVCACLHFPSAAMCAQSLYIIIYMW